MIVHHDMLQIWKRKNIGIYLLLIPLVLAVVLPILFIVVMSLLPVDETAKLPEALLNLLPDYSVELTYSQTMFMLYTDLLAPMFFLIIPVVCAVAAASCVFEAERENGTLESLMLTAMNNRSLYNAKISGSIVLSLIITYISFLAFTITTSVGNILLSVKFFFNTKWMAIILLLIPAIVFFCVVFMSTRLGKAENTGEAFQYMGYFITIIVFVYILQFIGLIRISLTALLIAALLLIIADIVLFNQAGRSFNPEEVLTKSFLKQRGEKGR